MEEVKHWMLSLFLPVYESWRVQQGLPPSSSSSSSSSLHL